MLKISCFSHKMHNLLKYESLSAVLSWFLKPVSDWESSVVQSPSSANVSSWPHTKLTSTAGWNTALPSGLVLLPLTFLGFTLWKPRHFGSLVSPVMRLRLWASHSLTAGRSVVFLSSSVSSLVSPPQGSVCDMSPPYCCRALKVRQQSPSGKTTKIMNHCSPSLFHSSFFPPLE